MIIGNRYGSKTNSGKSITNLEYLCAKKKNVPIYVFIMKQMLSIIPLWKDNKQGDFSNVVDSTDVFDFIIMVREEDNRWCQEFETAQDITNILKIQLSYLFKESLDIRSKVISNNLPDFWADLSNKALNILLEKGDLFELNFFRQTGSRR